LSTERKSLVAVRSGMLLALQAAFRVMAAV
jgi:hypothetical protein